MLHDLDMWAEVSVILGTPEICIKRTEQNICLEVAVLYYISNQKEAFALVISSSHP